MTVALITGTYFSLTINYPVPRHVCIMSQGIQRIANLARIVCVGQTGDQSVGGYLSLWYQTDCLVDFFISLIYFCFILGASRRYLLFRENSSADQPVL